MTLGRQCRKMRNLRDIIGTSPPCTEQTPFHNGFSIASGEFFG